MKPRATRFPIEKLTHLGKLGAEFFFSNRGYMNTGLSGFLIYPSLVLTNPASKMDEKPADIEQGGGEEVPDEQPHSPGTGGTPDSPSGGEVPAEQPHKPGGDGEPPPSQPLKPQRAAAERNSPHSQQEMVENVAL